MVTGPTSDYETMNHNILAILQGVSDVGILHDRIRYADKWQTMLDLFQLSNFQPPIPGEPAPEEGILLGWMLTRTGLEPVDDDSSFGATFHLHHMQLQGIMAFSDDGSELVFQSLINRVVAALEGNSDLWGELDVEQGLRRPVVPVIDLRKFGSMLAHYCEMEFLAATKDPH